MRKREDLESDDAVNGGGGRGRRGRRLRAPERRAQLLETALPVFARCGYVGTGTRDLARAAGVTEPVIYRHFPSKAALFCALVDEAQARLVAGLEAAMGGVKGAAARLEALAAGLPALLETYRDELRVLNAAALVHEDADILAAAGGALRRIGLALAAAFRGAGLRRGVRAETAGFLLLEVGMGASMLHALALPEMEGERFTASAVRALLHGIAR